MISKIYAYKDSRNGKFRDGFMITPMDEATVREALEDGYRTVKASNREPHVSVFMIGTFNSETGAITPNNPVLVIDYSSIILPEATHVDATESA